MRRRQLLKALGLGALAGLLRSPPARGGDGTFPTRVVFFVQPHGHVPSAWTLPIPGAPPTLLASRSLAELAPGELPEVLRPLHPFRSRLLVIEGLSHTAALADIALGLKAGGGDFNNHDIAVASLLTCARALQRQGAVCSGGARSLDQELALRTVAPGRFGSRVYGSDYVPNATVAPFSFLGPGQAAPMVGDPAMAYADLLEHLPAGAGMTSDLAQAQRLSVLDTVAREYAALAPRLGRAGRQKLDQHRALIRDLELSLGAAASAACDGVFNNTGHSVTQFMRLVRLALACDLTRVVTFVAPVPQCPEFGYPADATVHGSYAHGSVPDNTSCGQMYTPRAERAMTDLGLWYAGHFALLLRELDSVPEGSGTLLDHTVVVWLTELGTPTHQHHDTFSLLAGGGSGFFKMGRYVRYPRVLPSPLAGSPLIGPAQSRLFVSLLQAMGQPDTSFGMTQATAANGAVLSLTGPLSELHAAS